VTGGSVKTVSVIIATYNKPHYLERVIDGYLHQSVPPDEIVVADDGSTEETARLVEKMRSESGFNIQHVWQEDIGFRLARVRNLAIARSLGDYLIFSDDDTIPCARMVEDHLRYAEKGFFIQGHRVMLGPGISASFTHRDIVLSTLAGAALTGEAGNIINSMRLPWPLIKRSKNLMGIKGCNMSFFREDLVAVNGFDEEYEGWGREDSDLAERLFKYGLKRKDIKFRAVCYHLHHGSHGRESLERNTTRLEDVVRKGDYRCEKGLDAHLAGNLRS